MKQSTLSFAEPPLDAEPAQVPFPEPVPARAAAPVSSDETPDEDAPAPTKAPAGPRSRAARIIALARALGVQSDAEAAGQLGPHPF